MANDECLDVENFGLCDTKFESAAPQIPAPERFAYKFDGQRSNLEDFVPEHDNLDFNLL